MARIEKTTAAVAEDYSDLGPEDYVGPDGKPQLTPGRARLVERHAGLAEWQARRAAKESCRDDLYETFLSDATLGLTEAAMAFDPGRGLKFSTYAPLRIWGAIRDGMRSEMPRGFNRVGQREGRQVPKRLSCDMTVADGGNSYEGDEATTYEGLFRCTSAESTSATDYHEAIDEVFAGLPKQQRQVMTLLYGHADTARMKSAGYPLELTESRVSQLHSQAVAILREKYGITPGEGPVATTLDGLMERRGDVMAQSRISATAVRRRAS